MSRHEPVWWAAEARSEGWQGWPLVLSVAAVAGALALLLVAGT